MIYQEINSLLIGSEVGSCSGSLVGSDLGVDIFGNVDGRYVWCGSESCTIVNS